MDLADELAAQGFRRLFIVHLHGAPNHQNALDEAGDYFHDLCGGDMVNLFGRTPTPMAEETAESWPLTEAASPSSVGASKPMCWRKPDSERWPSTFAVAANRGAVRSRVRPMKGFTSMCWPRPIPS